MVVFGNGKAILVVVKSNEQKTGITSISDSCKEWDRLFSALNSDLNPFGELGSGVY